MTSDNKKKLFNFVKGDFSKKDISDERCIFAILCLGNKVCGIDTKINIDCDGLSDKKRCPFWQKK